MPTIDNISPGFRDALLNRNIISDTVEDNGLFSLLAGIGLPVSIETLPIAINPSNDIEEEGKEFQETTLLLNKYKGTSDDYRKVDLYYLPSTYESFTTYLDKNGSLNFGGPATQISDMLGSIPILGEGFDIRSSLAGRILTATGLESDSPIGVLGAKYLGEAMLTNVAFNTLDETIGKINTNPLSLANGDPLILPTYDITVPIKKDLNPVDILQKITGAKSTVSLLDESSSIFTFNEKSNTGVSFLSRVNNMIKNTGKGQILSLFANINTNTNPNLIGKRNGYNPGYTDSRKSKGENTEGGTNQNVYAFQNRLKENISNPDSYPISKSNTNDRTKEIQESGFPGLENLDKSYNNDFARDGSTNDYGKTDFIWSDNGRNYLGTRENDLYDGTEFNNAPKSILFKTQELFNSGKMRVLTTGKSIEQDKEQINSSVTIGGQSYMSKGSAVRSYLEDGIKNEDPDHMFCRTWSTVDRYNQIYDLQKHSGIKQKGGKNRKFAELTESVLEDTGMVRIAPYVTDNAPADIKRFMFSIENLAWNDDLNKLLDCEKGPGDLLTGKRGRIMWFPPYSMSFNESVSVNWDKKDFIGRGEPIYTYNNTERTGSLSWQIVVDHPNYMNYFPQEWNDDEINSFFAGCLEMQDIRDNILTKEEQAQFEVKNNTEVKESVDKTDIEPLNINFFFPNDVSVFPYEKGGKNYEDGLQQFTFNTTVSTINPQLGRINYNDFSDGSPFGLLLTQDEGIVSKKDPRTNLVKQSTDNTNFGLNGFNNPSLGQINKILKPSNNKKIVGLYDPELITSLSDYFKNECKYCQIEIAGSASIQGSNSSANKILSEKRAETIKKWFKDNILKNDSLGDKRFKKLKATGEVTGTGCPPNGSRDLKPCKLDRTTEVIISYNANFASQDKGETNTDPATNGALTRIPISRFFSECNYFRKMEQDDRFTYNTIREKIQYFQPGFHSITPEGFNSRLTFLHQCTRQGSTADNDGNPDNLSFGRPPISILRIGDFYHTKIAIDSLTIDYDPLVWDLNPEGIGVQPMIANVTISFAFLGGSSLKGPINRLQNAISSNFYANTQIYEPRAETIEVITKPTGQEQGTGKIKEGTFPNSENKDTTNQSNTNLTVAQQEDEGEKELARQAEAERKAKEEAEKAAEKAKQEAKEAKENDLKLLRGISIDSYSSPDDSDMHITFNIHPKANTKFSLTKVYTGKIYVVNNSTKKIFEVGTLKAQPNDEKLGNFILNSVYGQTIVEKISKKELVFEIFDTTDLINELKIFIEEPKVLKLEWDVPETRIISNISYSDLIADK